jgi:hypothetical protein
MLELRTWLRSSRLEAVVYGAAVVAITGLSIWIARSVSTAADAAAVRSFGNIAVYLFLAAGVGAPAIACLVGTSVAATEIEQGTAALSWALDPSRLRWLRFRVSGPLLFLVPLMLILGLSTDIMEGSLHPSIQASATFDHYGLRGLLLLPRAALAFAIGLACGAILGRLLGAMLVALVASTGALMAAQLAAVSVLRPSASILDDREPGAMVLAFRTVSDQGALRSIGLPGLRYPELISTEVAILVVATMLALVTAIVVVRVRRPSA